MKTTLTSYIIILYCYIKDIMINYTIKKQGAPGKNRSANGLDNALYQKPA